ncbi:MAG: hypothetical protein ACFFCO_11670 [Promethearchaeota archaeon]
MISKEDGIRGFYIAGWKSGKHIFSRTWWETEYDPMLLSSLMTSLEMMALNLTSEQVNLIALENSRFFFKLDKESQLLFILTTGLSKSTAKYYAYLDYLSKYFLEHYRPVLTESTVSALVLEEQTEKRIATIVDTFVDHWEKAEKNLIEVKVQDVLEIYSLFFSTIIMKCLDEQTRRSYWSYITQVLQDNPLSTNSADSLLMVLPGIVNYEELGVSSLEYEFMLKRLNKILRSLVVLAKQVHSPEHYQSMFFQHIVPMIQLEHQRLKTYQLNDLLVMHLL